MPKKQQHSNLSHTNSYSSNEMDVDDGSDSVSEKANKRKSKKTSSASTTSNNKKQKRSSPTPWSKADDLLLRQYAEDRTLSWRKIAEQIFKGKFTSGQCHQHWHRVLSNTINKDEWTASEEWKMVKFIARNGTHSWSVLSKFMGNGRIDIQCRQKWKMLTKSFAKLVQLENGGYLIQTHRHLSQGSVEELNFDKHMNHISSLDTLMRLLNDQIHNLPESEPNTVAHPVHTRKNRNSRSPSKNQKKRHHSSSDNEDEESSDSDSSLVDEDAQVDEQHLIPLKIVISESDWLLLNSNGSSSKNAEESESEQPSTPSSSASASGHNRSKRNSISRSSPNKKRTAASTSATEQSSSSASSVNKKRRKLSYSMETETTIPQQPTPQQEQQEETTPTIAPNHVKIEPTGDDMLVMDNSDESECLYDDKMMCYDSLPIMDDVPSLIHHELFEMSDDMSHDVVSGSMEVIDLAERHSSRPILEAERDANSSILNSLCAAHMQPAPITRTMNDCTTVFPGTIEIRTSATSVVPFQRVDYAVTTTETSSVTTASQSITTVSSESFDLFSYENEEASLDHNFMIHDIHQDNLWSDADDFPSSLLLY